MSGSMPDGHCRITLARAYGYRGTAPPPIRRGLLVAWRRHRPIPGSHQEAGRAPDPQKRPPSHVIEDGRSSPPKGQKIPIIEPLVENPCSYTSNQSC